MISCWLILASGAWQTAIGFDQQKSEIIDATMSSCASDWATTHLAEPISCRFYVPFDHMPAFRGTLDIWCAAIGAHWTTDVLKFCGIEAHLLICANKCGTYVGITDLLSESSLRGGAFQVVGIPWHWSIPCSFVQNSFKTKGTRCCISCLHFNEADVVRRGRTEVDNASLSWSNRCSRRVNILCYPQNA